MRSTPEQHPEDYGIGRLFYVISEAIIAADLASERIVLWNRGAADLLGYTAEEALGMRLDALVPDTLRDLHLAGIARYRDGGAPVLVGGAPVIVPAVTKDGETRQVALSLTNVSEDGTRAVVLAVLRDVTAQLAAEHELAAANQAMRRFVATASHDLRTPLASVLGFASMLAENFGVISDAQKQESAQAILRAARQASRLVDDLLTLSQIQAHVVRTSVGRVTVADAVRDAVAGIELAIDVAVPDGIQVSVDADHLRRILENYLTNAARYGAPPIRVSATAVPDGVELRVHDSGSGVPDTFVEHLFTSFARADTSRSDSIGLGLSIVKGLAVANGGDVFYEPVDGGCCFGVRLPAVS